MGIFYEYGIVDNGVVGFIYGCNGSSKVVALCVDIDVLFIMEVNEVFYKFKNEGVMYVCGYDVYIFFLLGVVCIFNMFREEFDGIIKFIFQFVEEWLLGGVFIMIKEGVLENFRFESILG